MNKIVKILNELKVMVNQKYYQRIDSLISDYQSIEISVQAVYQGIEEFFISFKKAYKDNNAMVNHRELVKLLNYIEAAKSDFLGEYTYVTKYYKVFLFFSVIMFVALAAMAEIFVMLISLFLFYVIAKTLKKRRRIAINILRLYSLIAYVCFFFLSYNAISFGYNLFSLIMIGFSLVAVVFASYLLVNSFKVIKMCV